MRHCVRAVQANRSSGHALVTMRPCAIGKAPLRRREDAAPLYRPAGEYIKLA